jgi:hypothetical protein
MPTPMPQSGGPAHRYEIDLVSTGFFSGNLNAIKLAEALNRRGSQGWRLARTIHETRRMALIFRREAHFLIFERPI